MLRLALELEKHPHHTQGRRSLPPTRTRPISIDLGDSQRKSLDYITLDRIDPHRTREHEAQGFDRRMKTANMGDASSAQETLSSCTLPSVSTTYPQSPCALRADLQAPHTTRLRRARRIKTKNTRRSEHTSSLRPRGSKKCRQAPLLGDGKVISYITIQDQLPHILTDQELGSVGCVTTPKQSNE